MWRMDEVLLWLVGIVGWVLGIVGFFRANKTVAQLKALQLSLQASHAAAPPPESQPAAQPEPAPAAIWAMTAPDQTAPDQTAPEQTSPEAPPEPTPPAAPEPRPDLETMLTQRWAVWLGAVALLFAGVFLVRYAAEQGLLGPTGRCLSGAVLGLALLAGAEYVRRWPPPQLTGRFAIDQTPGALAAGGCAILFGAAYGVGGFYELVPPAIGFALMAIAALIGLFASLRFGPLAAAIGLAGAFATPALVTSNAPSIAFLFFYLLAITAAAQAVMRWTAWVWLGWASAAGGAFWVLIAIGLRPMGIDAWAVGLFVPAAVVLNLALLPDGALWSREGRGMAWLPLIVLGIAMLLLGATRPDDAFRAAIFLLGPITVWKAAREPRLDRLPWLAAGFGLLVLLVWYLPAWKPTGESITIDGVVQAILPGDWAPVAIIPLLTAAALLAAFNAAVGLWFERRAPSPLVWAALPAAVPVLAMAVAYARVAGFQTDIGWGAAGLILAAALVFAAHLARQEHSIERAGVHAAGASAALSLACAMVLHDHWLTLALAVQLPVLALIEERSGVAALRQVALAIAAVVLLRLLPNWNIVFYPFGHMPILNGLIVGYALPAAAFAAASLLFRRRADDLLVRVLEAGAITLLAAFVALEVRHTATGGTLRGDVWFSEAAFNLLFLALQARVHLWLAERTGRAVLAWAWRIEGTVALVLGVAVILINPTVTGDAAGWPALAAAYLVPAALVASVIRGMQRQRWLGLYAVMAVFTWIFVQIRMLFHPTNPGLFFGRVDDAELWCWSGGWMAYGVAMLAVGIWRGWRELRQAGLAIVALVAAKVFLLDMAGLTGLWRVVSFLGLGLALIGLNAAYRRFVLPAAAAAILPRPAPPPEPETP